MFFVFVNIIGFVCNAYLWYIDIKYYDGVLNKVDSGDEIQDLITSPTIDRKELIRASQAKDMTRQSLLDYKLDKSNRETLKKSMASHPK